MKTKLQFHYIELPDEYLVIREKMEPLPIVWNNRGLYVFLPVQMVENINTLIDDIQNHPDMKISDSPPTLHYSQGFFVPLDSPVELLQRLLNSQNQDTADQT